MARVRIAPPDTEEDITAEQVAAYLLRPGSGWVEVDKGKRWHGFYLGTPEVCTYFLDGIGHAIDLIARAEQRRPSAVLADIVGPARAASVGASCRGEEDRASILVRARCRVKMSLAHSQAERAEQEARRAEREALLGYIETADAEDSAARGAGEESAGT